MNNTTIIKTFRNDDSNITYIHSKYCQIMTTVAYRILKLEYVIEKSVMAGHIVFTAVTFVKINSFTYINSIVIQHLQ